jgi:translation initiation factor IF-2
MRESKDNSLLFSLKALGEMEQKRIEEDLAARERARAAEERQRARLERLAHEAEMRRVEEEEKRRLEAERARRAEEAELEAQRLAAIERARAEVEAVAKAERVRSQAAHDIELAKARAAAARGRYRFFLGLSVFALVAVGSMAAMLSKELRVTTEEDVRRASALESARRDRDEAQQMLSGARQEIGDLRERLRVPGAPPAAPEPPKGAPAAPGKNLRKPPKRGEPAPEASCDEWDPMGGCLPPKKK